VRLKILVVDDEAAIGQAVRRTLFGYDITVTTSALDAIARVRDGERFDAIVSDINMPEMDGRELVFQLAAIVPSLAHRVLFLTGDADAIADLGDRPKLAKPFETHMLRARIEDLFRPTGKRAKVQIDETDRLSKRPTQPAPAKAGGDDDD
jgi:two-component system cell cycle sensor histidine kinase/response regulator CckA